MHDRNDYESVGRKLARAWLKHPKLARKALASARRPAVVFAAIVLAFGGNEDKATSLAHFVDSLG